MRTSVSPDGATGGSYGQPRVAICVITWRRPQGLARLLDALAGLSFERGQPRVEVVVVDNDPTESARPICDRRDSQLAVRYEVEARRGIPFARNTAMSAASERAEFIAFIDDDEVPTALWLDELLAVRQTYDADVVAAPTLPQFEESPPAWVREGAFFHRIRHDTGTPVRDVATGNVLMRSETIRRLPYDFDERMAMTGGSDTHFFRRLHRDGARMVWADDAIVHELIPAHRVSVPWLMQRAFRIGTALAFIERDLTGGPSAFRSTVVPGLRHLFKGLTRWPFALLKGKASAVHCQHRVAQGAGLISGWLGFQYLEYAAERRP